MAIIAIEEITDPQVRGQVAEDGTRTYNRVHQILTDNPYDGVQTILSAVGLPRRGLYYQFGAEFDPQAICNNVRPERNPIDMTTWKVYSDYSTNFKSNPLDQPPKFSWGTESFRRVLEVDVTGKPFLNSARRAFDPPYEDDDSYLRLRISLNSATFDELSAYEYVNSINEDPWLGKPVFTWYCKNIEADEAEENDISYWAVVLEFLYNPESWLKEILNQGYDDITGERLLTPTGQVPAAPVLLDALGFALAPGEDPTYELFQPKREMPFNSLFPSP